MHRPVLRWLSAAALTGVVAATFAAPTTPAVAAPAPAAFCADGSQPMMTQDEAVELAEGTPVTGLTVVKGTQPVSFTGRYTGHVENALGQGVDMLLFELSGAGIDSGDPRAGIWSGMSGSPVYAQDGRLIGAVAYGLNADNLPIAGVTPADYMQQTGVDRTAAPARVSITRAALTGVSARTETRLAGETIPRLKMRKVVAGGAKGNALANRSLARVPGDGASARAARKGGFAAAAAPSVVDEPLVPGGNIAVGYTTGDLFAGGVGTVTAICGSTVWAFGHPMDFAGETSLSIHNASTAMVVPDSTGTMGSFKQVSRIGQQIGTITYDGYGAVRGELGRIAGFPVTTHVHNAAGKRVRTYSGRVVDPQMASFGVGYASAFAAVDTLDNMGSGTARQTWRIDYRLSNGRTGVLVNNDVHASRWSLGDQLSGGVASDVARLLNTDLADVTITAVTTKLTLEGAKARTYRPAGAQRWNGKAWVTLHGSTVAKGRTLTVRPLYREYVNGRPQGLRPGDARSFVVTTSALGTASVTYSATSSSQEECEVDEETGDIWCYYYGEEDEEDEDDTPRTFSALVAKLDALRSGDRGTMTASWKWRSSRDEGLAKRTRVAIAPGAVTGSYTATFRLKR